MKNKDLSYAVCFYSFIGIIIIIAILSACARGINPNNFTRQRSDVDSWWRLCSKEETAPEKPFAKLCKTICGKWKTKKSGDKIIEIECEKDSLIKIVKDLNDPETHQKFRSAKMRLKK